MPTRVDGACPMSMVGAPTLTGGNRDLGYAPPTRKSAGRRRHEGNHGLIRAPTSVGGSAVGAPFFVIPDRIIYGNSTR